MSRSHLSARYLLKQIESDRSNRAKRDIRPAWLVTFTEAVAEMFDPAAGVGRVGFDCRLDEEGWFAALYLGAVELVGGKSDGQTERPGFTFDLKALLEHYSRVDALSWNVLDHGDGNHADGKDDPGPRSFLSIDGIVAGNRLRMEVHSAAPGALGPGLRRLADGRVEPI